MREDNYGPDHVPILDPIYDGVIDGVDVYVAGTEDSIASNRRLSVQKTMAGRWVGSINANLRPYYDFHLEVRLPDGSRTTFLVGPRFRRETLIRGNGPAPSL